MNRLSPAVRLLTPIVCLLLSQSSFAGPDWTYWVGPQYTGVSPEKNLPDKWDPKGGPGSNVIWSTPIGSRSTPTLMNGRLYLLTNSFPEDIKQAGEKIVCLDANTGQVLWEFPFNVYLTDVPIERVGWSSVVCDPQTGYVYAQGVCGYFCCVDGNSGKLIWDHSMSEEYGFLSTYGGRTNYPVIHENNVLIGAIVIGWGTQAKPNHRILALDKTNGQPVWFEGTRDLPKDTTYSAPVLAVIDGELQMIFGGGDGSLYSFQPRTGKKLWSYDLSGHGINTTPLVVGDRVYCGHSEENAETTEMGALVCLDATQRGNITQKGEVWKKTEYDIGRSSPIHLDGKIYAVDDRAKLHCLNASTGQELSDPVRFGTMMRANLLYADGKLYANEVNGRGYILKPTETGAEIVHRYRFPSGEECHGSPIACNGRLYIPTTGAMYCVGIADNQIPAGELPELPVETPASQDGTPAQVQLVPAESLLYPGFQQNFQARLYNAQGQFLGTAKPGDVEFSIKGPGTIDATGMYTIPKDHDKHEPAYVTARINGIQGQARIRIVPDLDWSFNFDDGLVPPTWVGCAYRHVPMDWDLLSKLRDEDPLTAGLYIYLVTEFTNFTPKREFDDSTPQERWKKFLEYFSLDQGPDKPKTVDEAKARFNPGLQRLVDEHVVAKFEWSTWDRPTGKGDEKVPEPRLTVFQGDRKIDGNGVLCKISTIPLGTNSQGWMGHPGLHDYTIQADVLCFSRQNKLPDAGLIGQRYILLMMGAAQQLESLTWPPQLNRFSVIVPFTWEPNTWYTMKFRTAMEGDAAVLKGKVWKKSDHEPDEWNIVAKDSASNAYGSPGLRGKSDNGEVFYDNLTVTRNAD